MTGYLCAIDVGTTGVKAALLTPEGELVCRGYREYHVVYPHPQWVEQSVEEVWNALGATMRAMLAQAGIDPRKILAIAISNQRATFVPVDDHSKPLTLYIVWQDLRGAPQCEWMKERIHPADYYAITGLDIGPTASISKILWLKQNQPEIFQKTCKFAFMQDMLLRQLGMKEAVCEHSTASWSGLLDVNKLTWSDDLLSLFDLPRDKLPALVMPGQPVGTVSKEAAEACGLVAGIPLISGGGDGQLSAVGCGVTHPGQVSLVMGTAAAIFTFLATPLKDPTRALYCVAHAVPRSWEMEGSALAAGAVYKWFRDTLGHLEKDMAAQLEVDPYELFDREIQRAAPGVQGLLVLPTFMGGGTPTWYPYARGAILGLTLNHTRRDVLRALVEGIFLEIKGMVEAIKALGVDLSSIRVVGGMAKSPVLNQLLANVLGVTVERPAVTDSTLVGAAICATLGCGMFQLADEAAEKMVQLSATYQPDKELSALYNRLFQTYCKAFDLLCKHGIFEDLKNLAASDMEGIKP